MKTKCNYCFDTKIIFNGKDYQNCNKCNKKENEHQNNKKTKRIKLD